MQRCALICTGGLLCATLAGCASPGSHDRKTATQPASSEYSGPTAIEGRVYYVRYSAGQVPGDSSGVVWRVRRPMLILEDRSVWTLRPSNRLSEGAASRPTGRDYSENDGELESGRFQAKRGDRLLVRRNRAMTQETNAFGNSAYRQKFQRMSFVLVNPERNEVADSTFEGWLVPEEEVPETAS